MNRKPFVKRFGVELFNYIKEEFDVVCYDGHAEAKGVVTGKVVKLIYPKMKDISVEMRKEILRYQGLPVSEKMDFSDVMLCKGKEIVVKVSIGLFGRRTETTTIIE
jgi:hypothetical protein